jgi:hypothetical protein
LTDITGIEGYIGLKTGSGNNNFYIFGCKSLRVVKSYESLNIFVSATTGLDIENSVQRDNCKYIVLAASMGAELFVMNNLSIATEAGCGLQAGGGEVRFSIGGTTVSIKIYL